jgi:7-cyano-7-deazaguanine synthase
MDKVVVLVSGGMDSTTLLWYAVKERGLDVIPVFFKYGQRHKRQEYLSAVHQCTRLDLVVKTYEINLPFAGSALTDSKIPMPTIHEVMHDRQPITYVPFRNTILLGSACSLAEGFGAHYVMYGAQLRDMYGYWDCTEEYLKKFNDLISLNRNFAIQVEAPLVLLSKADIVLRAMRLGVNLSDTYSCYKGGEIHCGACPTCYERRRAFIDARVPDPTAYEKIA